MSFAFGKCNKLDNLQKRARNKHHNYLHKKTIWCFSIKKLHQKMEFLKPVYKPSSVFDDYLSRHNISAVFKRCMWQSEQPMRHFYLASGGVYIAPAVTSKSVSSYLALSTLPIIWRYISVALSLKSPSPAVNRHPVLRCSDFPRGKPRNHLADLVVL